ncbi:zinc finger protein 182-like [Tigriopus californicus]|uniref:zinc finger protein 182-like n=1 Tax=Tigriopus californicus TaxID=6832 RepID=UPI0027D9DEC0|nr:zinc finger protein 182-like [Tigriopus californicus]|eukprot:TCALIF_03978-PA protein Name:"Similar to Kr-h1 Krueppel homolog 1 (Drosophila melanogaster)" AED:0.47 eAED:0.47 QI:0/-1/0/1/-1/1/1/0/420
MQDIDLHTILEDFTHEVTRPQSAQHILPAPAKAEAEAEAPPIAFTVTPLETVTFDLLTPPPSISPVSIVASELSTSSASSPSSHPSLVPSSTDPESILGLIQFFLHIQSDLSEVHQWIKAAFDHQDLILARQLWLYLHPNEREHELDEVNDKNLLIQNILKMIHGSESQNTQEHAISINLDRLVRISRDVLKLPAAMRRSQKTKDLVHHVCKYCQKTFTANTNLKSHIRKYHELDKGFICSFCGSVFGDSKNLRDHELRVHEEELRDTAADPLATGTNPSSRMINQGASGGSSGSSTTTPAHVPLRQEKSQNSVRLHPCGQCNKAFKRKNRLREHHHRVHLQDNHNKTNCPFPGCSSLFTSKWLLKQHVSVVHWKEKTHSCPECDKKFGYAHHVVVHMKQIHGIENPRKHPQQNPSNGTC